MSGRCLEGVWNVSGMCLEGVNFQIFRNITFLAPKSFWDPNFIGNKTFSRPKNFVDPNVLAIKFFKTQISVTKQERITLHRGATLL